MIFVLYFIHINPESALQCYFCEIGDPDCNADDWGREIGCSSDPGNINYGDACMVEHIGIISCFVAQNLRFFLLCQLCHRG